jgi:hypothetical protein
VTPFDHGGFMRAVALEITFSDAVAQQDKDRGVYLNVGESWTLNVMLPPAF